MAAPKMRVKTKPTAIVKTKREDVHTETSQRKGMGGAVETAMRRFRNVGFALLLSPLALVCCACLGLAAAPGLYWFNYVSRHTEAWPEVFHYAAIGFGLSSGYLIYGLSLLFILPAVNFLIPLRVKPFRGPWYSLPAIPWYVHNALCYMMRFTFLEFLTPSPLNVLFYRMMGMKIGKGVVINTSHISDPCLITLEDYVTLGGSATVFAHYGQKGYLIIAPVTIGRGTTIGLKASVMGGAQVGANVVVRPHGVVLPRQVVPDGETV